MKGKSLLLLTFSLLLVLGLVGIGGLWAKEPAPPTRPLAGPLGTAFTYQGRLIKDGNPVNDTCDFEFSLYDAPGDGMQIGTTQTKTNVSVSDGLFTVELDFGGSAFQGDARWLKIAVRCPAGSGSYTTLSPRQELTATPYALYALEAADLTCSQCVDAPEVGFYYAGSSSQGGPALDLSCSACISSGEIENGAVTSAKIQDGEVSASDLEDGAALAEILDDDGSGSALDADLLDGQHASELLPSGVIVMWSGAIEDIPEGWALCDGTNGSPDLRDRFVYGISEGETPGATGGAATHSHLYNDVPEHEHTASSSTAGEHYHTSMELNETRGVYASQGFPPGEPSWYVYQENAFVSGGTSVDGNHSHSITIDPQGVTNPSTDDADHLPPYYKLAFIIKL